MLHGAIAINKQNTDFASGWSHGKCSQTTPVRTPAYGPITVVPMNLFQQQKAETSLIT
jgi:hypothetical protein